MNFVTFPLFFLSGALYPLQNLPVWIKYLSFIDPLTYGVDGLRGVLLGFSSFRIISDFFILTGFSLIMVLIGAYLFEKSESI
jgi:ABC-2 type transport system permease protein